MNMDEKVYVWCIKHTIAKTQYTYKRNVIQTPGYNIHCHLVPEHSFRHNPTFATGKNYFTKLVKVGVL